MDFPIDVVLSWYAFRFLIVVARVQRGIDYQEISCA